jgi:hypothetical protein
LQPQSKNRKSIEMPPNFRLLLLHASHDEDPVAQIAIELRRRLAQEKSFCVQCVSSFNDLFPPDQGGDHPGDFCGAAILGSATYMTELKDVTSNTAKEFQTLFEHNGRAHELLKSDSVAASLSRLCSLAHPPTAPATAPNTEALMPPIATTAQLSSSDIRNVPVLFIPVDPDFHDPKHWDPRIISPHLPSTAGASTMVSLWVRVTMSMIASSSP